MATKNEIDIILKLSKQGKGVAEVKKELGEVEKQAKKSKVALSDIGDVVNGLGRFAAGSVAALAVFKEALDMSKQGAGIKQTQILFNELVSDIGGNGVDAIERLRTATGGAVTDLELMQGASKLLRFGLADNVSELTELTNKIVRLKDPTVSATEAIDSFGLMMANQSIERLDTFGLSSGRVRSRVIELTASI